MHEKGVDAVVARMKLEYKVPLRPDDEFYSRLWLEKQGIKYIFHQDLFRASDEALCFRGEIILVCLVNGQLSESEDYDRAFEAYIKV
jgi:acyl-CoA thioester hydrolase